MTTPAMHVAHGRGLPVPLVAVTPPAARDLIATVVEAITGEAVAA